MVTILDTVKTAPKARHPEKANRPDNPIQRKPEWIRVKAPGSPVYKETQGIVKENGLFTVCEEAGCPNIGECWSKKHATMMIMGDTCTRACAFCNVKTGLPAPLDPSEPENVALAVEKLGLLHVVITSVDRDDLILGATRAARVALKIDDARIAQGIPASDVLPELRRPVSGDDLMDAERAALRRVLSRTNGNVSQAAVLLGISRATLHRKLKKLDMH